MSSQNTKEHILLSTIDAIEKYGLSHLTTRLIAETAGVNNAALHYYFGTKENLIDAALNQTANHMLEDTAKILGGDTAIEGRIRGMVEYIIDGVLKFPNIIRAHMTGPLFYEDRQSDLSNMLDNWVSLALDALELSLSEGELARKKIQLNMIFSVILLSGLFNNSSYGEDWVDLKDPVARTALMDEIVDMLLVK
ncbi:TetR/AcrR family transcriptional regulator [bacterium]|nr:TetR/AcrR family transcriptional regulator [bacterium]